MTYGLAGEKEKALVLRKELTERRTTEYINPLGLIAIDMGMGNREGAYDNLLAYVNDGGSGHPLEVSVGPLLDKFEEDPRWAALFRKAGRFPVLN
jgi:hypothetical protein